MAADNSRFRLWPLALVWILTAAAYAVRAVSSAATVPLFVDTDDAMRLTEVHDFLRGQNWFDLVQHRLNTPYGAELHWSRLVDAPEALLIGLLRPFLASSLADIVAAYLWPLLLLAVLLWATAKLALRLGGAAALWPALLLVPFGIISLTEFVPGRFDHHSVQALLSFAMLYCTILALDRPRFAVGAGVAAAAALAVGIEGLPLVAATVLVFPLAWVGNPRHAGALRDFGLSFGLSAALALTQGVAPPHWFTPRLDAISIVYAGAALLGGAAFLALSLLSIAAWQARLLAALGAGVVVGAVLLGLDPAILKGPYAALDPWLVSHWLAHISESQTWWQSVLDDPVYPLAVTVPLLIALAAAVWNAIRNKPDRAAWLIYGGFLAVGLLVLLIQLRAARVVTPLAVPGCAVLVATTWGRFRSRPRPLPALAFLLETLGSAGLVVAAMVAIVAPLNPEPGSAASSPAARQSCLMPAAFADLAGLPPERIMAPIDLGSHLLLYTPHAVVGAPYHRNQQGLLDTFHFFNGPIAEARQIVEARGVGLVVLCPAMSEVRGLADRATDSFATLFAAGALPDWLVDESLPGSPLKVYAVNP